MVNAIESTVEEKVGGGAKMDSEMGKSMKKNIAHNIPVSGSGLNATSAAARATRTAWIKTKVSGSQNRFMAQVKTHSDCPTPQSPRLPSKS